MKVAQLNLLSMVVHSEIIVTLFDNITSYDVRSGVDTTLSSRDNNSIHDVIAECKPGLRTCLRSLLCDCSPRTPFHMDEVRTSLMQSFHENAPKHFMEMLTQCNVLNLHSETHRDLCRNILVFCCGSLFKSNYRLHLIRCWSACEKIDHLCGKVALHLNCSDSDVRNAVKTHRHIALPSADCSIEQAYYEACLIHNSEVMPHLQAISLLSEMRSEFDEEDMD